MSNLPPTAFPWEGEDPLSNTFGFTVSAANVKLIAGYAVFCEGNVYLLYVHEQIAHQPPVVWRRFHVPAASVLSVAEDLCACIEEYAENFGPLRPTEDLDLDDYLEHIRLRVQNVLC